MATTTDRKVEGRGMLIISRKQDEEIFLKVGDELIRILVIKPGSGRVRFGIEASRSVKIIRGEIDGRGYAKENPGSSSGL